MSSLDNWLLSRDLLVDCQKWATGKPVISNAVGQTVPPKTSRNQNNILTGDAATDERQRAGLRLYSREPVVSEKAELEE